MLPDDDELAQKLWKELAPVACWNIRCTNAKIDGSNFCILHTFGPDVPLDTIHMTMKKLYNKLVSGDVADLSGGKRDMAWLRPSKLTLRTKVNE